MKSILHTRSVDQHSGGGFGRIEQNLLGQRRFVDQQVGRGPQSFPQE